MSQHPGLAAIAVLLVAACTYRVEHVPPAAAFERPVEEVLRAYPQVAPIFPDYGGGSEFGMARAADFVEAWGEPRERSLSWWNLWPGNWPFVPQYLWTWDLGAATVTCRVDHPFYELWEPTLCSCRVR